MKIKLTSSLFAICAVLFVASCTKEPIEIDQPNTDQPNSDQTDSEQTPADSLVADSTFFVALHEGVNFTKTTLNSNLVPEWVVGDAIGVTTAESSNVKCNLMSAEEGKFGADGVKGSAPFYAVYPYAETNTFDGSVLSATVPSEQKISAGQCVAPGALVAGCVSLTNALSFKNCVSLMQLQIPAGIKKVVVESLGENEYLTGNFTMDMSEAELVAVLPENGAGLSTSVTIVPGEDTFDAGIYYIAVLPTSLSGVKMTFTNSSDETVTVEKEAEVLLARSNGINFGNFFVYEISTPEDLCNWANSKGKFTAWDVVTLKADIDMSNHAAEYVEAVNFEGTFNGNGKTITGLTTPLFANLYGSVNNLTLNSNITYTGVTKKMPGHNQVVGILAHIAYNSKHSDAKISKVTTKGSITVEMAKDFTNYFGVAGLVGGCNGVVVEDCENQAAVEVKSLNLVVAEGDDATAAANVNRILAAGIVAQTKGNTTAVQNCKNSGSVKIGEGVTTISQSIAAGVAAYADSNVTYTGCSNTGNITNSAADAKVYFTGGVLGTLGVYGDYNGASSAAWKGTFTNCSNSGTIVDNDRCATAVDHNVGGVVGYACINGVTLDGLSNAGPVELSSSLSAIASTGGLIGKIQQYNPSILQNCTNETTGTVTVNSQCVSLYAAGVLAFKNSQTNREEYKAHITILNCSNKGNIINNGTGSTDIRIGGIAGQLTYAATFGKLNGSSVSDGCSNSGSIISSSSQTASTRIGGILAQSGNLGVNVYDCKNTGNISFESSATVAELYIGGVGGILGTTPVLDGCSSNCTITKAGDITKAYGAALIARSSSASTTIKNCSVAGTVFGDGITTENYTNYLCAYYSSKNPVKVLENNSCLTK